MAAQSPPNMYDAAVMPFAWPDGYADAFEPPDPAPREAFWFAFDGDRLLVLAREPAAEAPDDPRAWPRPAEARVPILPSIDALGLRAQSTQYLGRLGGTPCFAADMVPAAAPEGYGLYGLRALFGVLDDAAFALAGRALQLVEWVRAHRHCGRCGALVSPRTTERALECPACRLVVYPRLAPAVMALVRRVPDEILLARSTRFPSGMYSTVAGFVEPGETLEQALAREVMEEVGVRVRDVRYYASQPWPFPHSLMIAFVADWEGGDIRIDAREIEDARWFKIVALPRLPAPISIARRLIDAVTNEMLVRAP
jgi:NAD+ diphosphatase